MNEPYHKQLHDILMKKGYRHMRVNRPNILCYDYYYDKFNDREIFFYEDESMQSFESDMRMKIKDFDDITDHIFSE